MLTFNKTYCKETVQKGTKSQVAGVLSALVEKVGGFSCCCRSFSSHTRWFQGSSPQEPEEGRGVVIFTEEQTVREPDLSRGQRNVMRHQQ